MNLVEILKPSYKGGKYANLITAFAVIAAVEYSNEDSDAWDLVIGCISIVLGVAFSKANNKKNDFWFAFIVASLISLGFVTIYSWSASQIIPALSLEVDVKPYYEIARFCLFISFALVFSAINCRKSIPTTSTKRRPTTIARRLLCPEMKKNMNPTNIGDFYVAAKDLPWKILREGYHFKLLRTCPVTGTWVTLFQTVAGASVPPHKHIGAAEYFVLKGIIEIRGGSESGGATAHAGDYGYEPNGIFHDKTYFPDPCEYLFISHGALQYFDAEGNTILVLDWLGITTKWEDAELVE